MVRTSDDPRVEEDSFESTTGGFVTVELPDWICTIDADGAGADVAANVARVVDPGAAEETIHWGRNYIYASIWDDGTGPCPVVVKQFKNQGLRRSLERRWRGSKAERSWRAAQLLVEKGLPTPRPIAQIESRRGDGPSIYVCARLMDAAEIRQFFRQRNGHPEAGAFPDIAPGRLLERLGSLLRNMHNAGIWYRDLSMGNVLVESEKDGSFRFFLVDTNRARRVTSLGLWRRCRDLCRLPILRTEDRRAFLAGYWGDVPSAGSPRRFLWTASMRAYLLKHAFKNRLKRRKKVRGGKHRGRHHPHIPPAEQGVGSRDKAVWDRLSDQPHQHAGAMEKLAIRAADLPSHLYDVGLILSSVPRVWSRYRHLRTVSTECESRFDGIGVCLRPFPDDPEAQLAAVAELGLKNALIRLHPWEDDHDEEEQLARELSTLGCDMSFSLPQNRELVRDRGRWQAAIEELAERFTPYGKHFQVGQAPNRSKWGTWTRREFVDLFVDASRVLRRYPGVKVLGPSVIDFEPHATMAFVNCRESDLRFDVVSHLLYVDRRGAPENPQAGFDTAGKAMALQAIAETGHSSEARSWITEVNWPLWEGPHSPAGRTVSVDEQTQANYLPRYFLLALGSGAIERAYWWRMIARGYGLIAPGNNGGLRRRPSFTALQTLLRQTDNAVALGAARQNDGVWTCHLRREDEEIVAAWSIEGERQFTLPRSAVEVIGRDGDALAVPEGERAIASPSICYFTLEG